MGFTMSIVAPKPRQQLCAEALFRLVQPSFANLPDHRCDEAGISLPDARMSAFARFSLTSPSLLAFDKQRAEDNWGTIYGITRAPGDTYMRETLDPVSPEALRPSCKSVFRPLQRGKALEDLVFLEGHDGVALEGTGYFSSPPIHCASCLQKVHRHGSIPSYHPMLGAALIHPDFRDVIPLMPEPIVKPDGKANNACERHAAKRFLAKLRQDPPPLQGLITEDSLRSTAPHLEPLHAYGCRDILGVQEGAQAYVFTQVQAAEEAGRVTYDERHDRAAGVSHRCRLVHDVPLQASRADVQVNFIESWEIGPDQVQPCRWVTDWRVSKRNVYKLMRGGRARWQSEHEPFKTLQNQGYHFEHNAGHGEQNLSVVLATLMRLAFLVDQTQQRCGAWFQAVWTKRGSTRMLWERIRAWFYDDALESMRELLEALLYGLKKSNPSCAIDASCSPAIPAATVFHRTRRYPIAVGKLCLAHAVSPLSTRHPVIADRQSRLKKRQRMVETLRELSAAMVT
jgi:hypothetical protein